MQDMATETGADLENIVYYKEETHYFVMTAKKESLLKFGVLKEDIPDEEGPGGDFDHDNNDYNSNHHEYHENQLFKGRAKILHPSNVDKEKCMEYVVISLESL